MKTTCSTSFRVPVRWLAGIARARLMLAGKAEAAAAVDKSFKNSRRSVLMLNSPLWIVLPVMAWGSLFAPHCDCVTIKLRLCNLNRVAFRGQLSKSTREISARLDRGSGSVWILTPCVTIKKIQTDRSSIAIASALGLCCGPGVVAGRSFWPLWSLIGTRRSEENERAELTYCIRQDSRSYVHHRIRI
jgi:hypothetical protein